jgi:Lytic transglycolase/Cysteine-rich secretory protein family
MEQYTKDTQALEVLYEKTKQHLPNHSFSSLQLKRLRVLEKNLARQLIALDKAKTPYQKKRWELQYRKSREALTLYVSSLSISSIRTKNIRTTTNVVPSISETHISEAVSPSSESLPDTWIPDSQADILFYADAFEGGTTSNGDVFSQSIYSAANCTTNLNQLIQVKYWEDAVIVTVNDRPNCEKHPSIVDLSKQAFSHLADSRAGKLAGDFRRLGSVPKDYAKSLFPGTTFEKLGIQLDSGIPNTYLPNDTFRITGTLVGGGTESLIYLVTPSGKIISFGAESSIPGRFSYSLPIFEIGKYDFVIAAGRSFQSARPASFYVLDPDILKQALKFSQAKEIPKVNTFSVHRFEATDLSPIHTVSVEAESKQVFIEMKISTKNQNWIRTGIHTLAFDPQEFKGITPGESAFVSFTTSRSSTPFSMDRITKEKPGLTGTYRLGPNYATTKEMNYISQQEWSKYTLTLKGDAKLPIHATAYIMTPSGKVDAVKFHSVLPGESVLSRTSGAVLQYHMKEEGAYLVEVNYTNGFPAIIEPIIFGNTLALLPNAYDLQEKTIESNMAYARIQILNDINMIRKEAWLNPVSFDANMQRISDTKADDMASNKYVWHQDSQWMYAFGLAESLGIEIIGSIGENVAWGTVGARYLQAGLSLSPGHRLNMLW